jgi:hypothetical protein
LAVAVLLLEAQTVAMVVILYLALSHLLAAVVAAHQGQMLPMQVLTVALVVVVESVITLLAVRVEREIHHQHHQAKAITEALEILLVATTIHKSMPVEVAVQLERVPPVLMPVPVMAALARPHRFPVHQLLMQAVGVAVLLINLLGLVALVVGVLALKQPLQQAQFLEPQTEAVVVVVAQKVMAAPQALAVLAL